MATEIATLVFEVDTKDLKKAKADMSALGKVTQTVNGKIAKVKPVADDNGKATGLMGRKAAMAGIQFEQMAGQIAMGQNPMRAVGVQAADLGFVLGVPLLGAVVGIGAAIGSVLIPILLNSGMKLSKLTQLADELGSAFDIAADGTVSLSSSLNTLAQQSEELASLSLALSEFKAGKGADDAIKGMTKSLKRFMIVQKESTEENEAFRVSRNNTFSGQFERKIQTTAKFFGISADNTKLLAAQMINVKNNTEGAIPAMQLLLADVLKNSPEAKKGFQRLVEKVEEYGLAEVKLRLIKEAGLDIDKDVITQGQAIINQLNERFLTQKKQHRQVLILQGITNKAEQDAILLLRQKIEDEEASVEATKKAAQERAKAFEAEMRAHDSAYKALLASQSKAIDDFNKQQDDADKLLDRLLNEEQLIIKSHERRRWIIMDNTALTQEQRKALILESEARMNEELLQMQRDQDVAKLTANDLYWATWLMQAETTMTSFNDITKEGIEAFETGFGSAFEKIIMDGEDIKGVVSGIFENMARAQIAALGQMAAEQLTHMLVGKALAKTAAATGAAAMISNATAQQQMAGLAAFASTAAIPITGPLAAPAAQAAAIAATAPAVLAITGAANAGAMPKATGGQVFPDRQYIVGERGPELLTMAGGQRGRITPNHMMGAGQLKVTVENYGSSNISVQKISETDVRIIAREVASQTVQREAPRVIATDIANPNGRVSKTLANNTSTQRRR